MNPMLKIERKALAAETRATRHQERHYRNAGRKLRGWQSFKHNREQPKPDVLPIKEKYLKMEQELKDKYSDELLQQFQYLNDHRNKELKRYARHLHLVDGFLRGHPYERIECTGTYNHPEHKFLIELAHEWTEDSDNEFKDKFVKWWDEAEAFIAMHEERRAKEREEKNETVKAA